MKKTVIFFSILLLITTGCTGKVTKKQAEILNDTIELEAIEVPEFPIERKTYCTNYAQRPYYFIQTDTKFIVIDTDGYVNLRDEPSVNSTIMTTIPNYTIVNEIHGKVGNWLLVHFFNSSAKESGYGYVHKSHLVQLPQINTNSDYDNNKELSRVLTLKSTGQKKDFTLQVFFFRHQDGFFTSGAVWEEGKNDTKPITYHYGIVFSHEMDYKNAGYEYDEKAPIITRYFFKENWGTGLFVFDTQETTNLIQTGTVILKAFYSNEGKKNNFAVKNDIILSGNATFPR